MKPVFLIFYDHKWYIFSTTPYQQFHPSVRSNVKEVIFVRCLLSHSIVKSSSCNKEKNEKCFKFYTDCRITTSKRKQASESRNAKYICYRNKCIWLTYIEEYISVQFLHISSMSSRGVYFALCMKFVLSLWNFSHSTKLWMFKVKFVSSSSWHFFRHKNKKKLWMSLVLT